MEGSVKFPCRGNTFLQCGKISNVITCEERGGEEIEQRVEQCIKAAKFRQELMTRSVNCGTRCFVPADKKLKVKNARQKVPRQVGSWDAALTSAVQCSAPPSTISWSQDVPLQ